MSESTQILELLARKSKVTPLSGTFVSYDGVGCQVDVGDGRMDAMLGSGYLPGVGEAVLVMFIDGIPYVMAPSTPRPHVGTVTAVNAGLVALSTVAGPVGPCSYSGSAPTVGQVMRLVWHGGPFAVPATAEPGSVAPGNPGGGGTTQHVDDFWATSTGTWNSAFGGGTATGYFNSEVWASNTTLGFWFYGTKTQDTIPGTAVIQRVQMYVAARQIQGGAPIFTVHDNPSPPGDALSGGVALGVSNFAWVDLPLSFGDALKQGGGAYGVGVRHGGYNIFKSLSADGMTGALRITSVY